MSYTVYFDVYYKQGLPKQLFAPLISITRKAMRDFYEEHLYEVEGTIINIRLLNSAGEIARTFKSSMEFLTMFGREPGGPGLMLTGIDNNTALPVKFHYPIRDAIRLSLQALNIYKIEIIKLYAEQTNGWKQESIFYKRGFE